MQGTRSIGVSRRALSAVTASGLALAGTIVLAAGQVAQADVMEQGDKVWVCKYVGKPGEGERLQTGGNPIEVGWQAAEQDKPGDEGYGEVSVGDEFADAQGRSVVIKINGSDPGIAACPGYVPPTTTTTTQPTTTTTTTTTQPSTTEPTTTKPPTTHKPKPPAKGGGGVTPGVGAPDTGGTSGETSPVGGIIGSGLLLAAGGVLAAEAVRRRRGAIQED